MFVVIELRSCIIEMIIAIIWPCELRRMEFRIVLDYQAQHSSTCHSHRSNPAYFQLFDLVHCIDRETRPIEYLMSVCYCCMQHLVLRSTLHLAVFDSMVFLASLLTVIFSVIFACKFTHSHKNRSAICITAFTNWAIWSSSGCRGWG